MIRRRFVALAPLLALVLALASPVGLRAQQTEPDARQILQMARSVFANERFSFEGELRPDNRRADIPLRMSVEGQDMVISIRQEPVTELFLSLGEGGGGLEIAQQPSPQLPEGLSRRAMTDQQLGATIRGTDLIYEDLGMRFLYWDQGAEKGEDAKVSARDCWTVLARNPGGDGPYGFVYVRVDRGTGALMQVIGYDHRGRLIKKFQVDDVQLHGGQYYLRRMRIETMDNRDTDDPGDDRVSGRTYLVLDEPERADNGF